MTNLDFWDDQKSAQNIINKINFIKLSINPIVEYSQKVKDLHIMEELLNDASDKEVDLYKQEILNTIKLIVIELNNLEITSFLKGPHDNCNAILSIHAGAGGKESCDWGEMLMRQYLRWAEKRQFYADIQDMQIGEETGISSLTMRIKGLYAYGYLKGEKGVHRLVRISPFDTNKRRHTSFCSIDVIAEIKNDIDIIINEEDLRIDTYCSSGKGGQHVNRTESAVRITHIPSKIVVTCQNNRSQYKNKASAMKTLKSRLYEQALDSKRKTMENFYINKGEIGWGNQIRSYIFHPYQMVKDIRTNFETSNIKDVIDGNIDEFINAWIRKTDVN